LFQLAHPVGEPEVAAEALRPLPLRESLLAAVSQLFGFFVAMNLL
jgi:hypothetical protein